MKRLIFVFSLLLFFPVSPALAQSDVFQIRRDEDKLPPLDEYKNVPKGLMIAPDDGKSGDEIKQEMAGSNYNYDTVIEMYKDGKYAQIVKSLEILVDTGHYGAAELLGIMYEFGQGVPKNLDKARELLTRAAEEGNKPLSQHHLGVMYYTGTGIEANPAQGLMWLYVAVIHYPTGPEKERAKQDRDNVYAQISRRERDIALQMAREWLSKRGEAHLLDLQQ